MRFTRGFESALYGLCVLHTVLGGKQGEAYVVPFHGPVSYTHLAVYKRQDLFFAAMNTIPALAITVIGYYLYAQSGLKPFVFGSTYTFTYTLNAIPVFPVAVIDVYKRQRVKSGALSAGSNGRCWMS